MARSRWKLCYFETSIWRRIQRIVNDKIKKLSKISYSRRSTIPLIYIYRGIFIHKGAKVRRCVIDPLKVGYKFGEFSFTRKPFHFPTKKTNKKNSLLIRR